MQFYYAKSTSGLYRYDVHGDAIPGDSVKISNALYAELVAGQAEGQLIVSLADGVPFLSGFPPSELHRWINGAWQIDLQERYAAKVAQINSACERSITGDFTSAALGELHRYSSQLDDQLNLTGVILAGLDSVYACRDTHGIKAFRPHSFAQLRRVGDDFTAFKLQQLQKANQLKWQLDQALSAGDQVALEAVTWETEQ